MSSLVFSRLGKFNLKATTYVTSGALVNNLKDMSMKVDDDHHHHDGHMPTPNRASSLTNHGLSRLLIGSNNSATTTLSKFVYY
jgi:hypothetical protein